MAISYCYWQLVVKNGNYILLLTSSFSFATTHKNGDLHLVVKNGNTFLHCYWHLIVKNGNCTWLLTSSDQELQFYISGQERQFHIANATNGEEWQVHMSTDIYKNDYFSYMVKNGNCTLLLTCSGQEWQFYISYSHLVVKNGYFTLLLTSSSQEWQFHMVTTHIVVVQEWQFHIATDI